jgi:hypothetical protein
MLVVEELGVRGPLAVVRRVALTTMDQQRLAWRYADWLMPV